MSLTPGAKAQRIWRSELWRLKPPSTFNHALDPTTQSADFSRIARLYRWMEYSTFGPLLHRTRCLRLAGLPQARRALVLGDGDGRFLQALLEANPLVEIDAVDCSPGMVRLAKSRATSVQDGNLRVHWFVQDAREFIPGTQFDLIVSHFFLDCFSTEEVAALVSKFSANLAPGGRWINSDFAIPPARWLRLPCWIIVHGLYLAFLVLANLRTQQLPDDTSAFQKSGLQLQDRQTLAAGLLKSELWVKP